MKLDLDDARRFVRESARHAEADPRRPLPPDAWFAALDSAATYVETVRTRARATLACDATHDAWGAWLELAGRGGPGAAYRAVLLKPEWPRAALVAVHHRLGDLLSRGHPEPLQAAKGSAPFKAWRRAQEADEPLRAPGRPLGPCPAAGPRGMLLEKWRLHAGCALETWCVRLGCAPGTYKRYLESEAALPVRAARLLAVWATEAPRLAAKLRPALAPKAAPAPRDVDAGDVSVAELQLVAALNQLSSAG